MEWTECLKGAVKFIEAHLLEEIEVPFLFPEGVQHYDRLFSQ